ncbi:hypothetical protein M405DRAFT_808052, partial [Rhizopogon salebrosus TDB-379]
MTNTRSLCLRLSYIALGAPVFAPQAKIRAMARDCDAEVGLSLGVWESRSRVSLLTTTAQHIRLTGIICSTCSKVGNGMR